MSTNTSSIRFSEVAPSIKISPSRRRDDKSEQPSNKHRKNIFDKEVASHKVLDAADLKRVNESDDDDDMDDSDTRVTIRDRQFEFSGVKSFRSSQNYLILMKMYLFRRSRDHAFDSNAHNCASYWDTYR